jgi:glutamyl-tRNA reductase
MKKEANIPYIGCVGLNHKTAPVELRERFSADAGGLAPFLEKTCGGGIEEVVLLSTCNRVEIYFTARDMNASMEGIVRTMEGVFGHGRARFEPHLYKLYSRDAVVHLLAVAASLDSMVVGENEIFFQVKNCYRQSVSARATGTVLNKLFHQAFRTAKRVRTETEISRNPLSIAYIATELARKIFEDIASHSALLIGAGEMGELILKYFTKHRVGEITIANRSLRNAQRAAEEINRQAHIVPLEDVAGCLVGADIVIASTASPRHIVTAEMLKAALKKREGRPLFIIDIAVPRNVDPAAGALRGVFLYNIDDLKNIADENLKSRLREIDLAMELVQSDADEFMRWYEGLAVVPAIVKMKNKFNEIRCGELGKYRRRSLKHLSEKDFRAVEELTRQIMTKTLHNPIGYLKGYLDGERKAKGSLRETTRLIEELFEK